METPARLLLIRHGETDWNRTRRIQGHADVPLNETGRRQAARAAGRLADAGLEALFASDLARAAETARIIGARAGLAPVLRAEWREIGLGALEGVDNAEPVRRHGELVSASARRDRPLAQGAETFAAFQARVLRGFAELCRTHAGRTVGVVGHGGSLKVLIAHLLALDPTRIDRLSLRGNTGLSVVDFRHGRPQLVLLNDTRHLDAPEDA